MKKMDWRKKKDASMDNVLEDSSNNIIIVKDIKLSRFKPPFIPRLKNAVDTRYIDPLFAKATPQDTPVDTYESVDEEFNGFSFNK